MEILRWFERRCDVVAMDDDEDCLNVILQSKCAGHDQAGPEALDRDYLGIQCRTSITL